MCTGMNRSSAGSIIRGVISFLRGHGVSSAQCLSVSRMLSELEELLLMKHELRMGTETVFDILSLGGID